MRLNIVAQNFELTNAITRYVEDRVKLALGPASKRINSVSVRLADINAERGGPDKRCRLVIWLSNLRTIVIDAVNADLYFAVDEAAGRAKEAVWRHLKRRRTLRREYANRSIRRLFV